MTVTYLVGASSQWLVVYPAVSVVPLDGSEGPDLFVPGWDTITDAVVFGESVFVLEVNSIMRFDQPSGLEAMGTVEYSGPVDGRPAAAGSGYLVWASVPSGLAEIWGHQIGASTAAKLADDPDGEEFPLFSVCGIVADDMHVYWGINFTQTGPGSTGDQQQVDGRPGYAVRRVPLAGGNVETLEDSGSGQLSTSNCLAVDDANVYWGTDHGLFYRSK